MVYCLGISELLLPPPAAHHIEGEVRDLLVHVVIERVKEDSTAGVILQRFKFDLDDARYFYQAARELNANREG